mgnify:CR=1 FL=1
MSKIGEYLLNYKNTAELLLTQFAKKREVNENYFFPKKLNIEKREAKVLEYIDSESPNINFLKLILYAKESNQLKLSPLTRLKAKKKEEEINNHFFKKHKGIKIGSNISFSKDQEEPVIVEVDGTILKKSYSTKFLDKITDLEELFMVFGLLFRFIDRYGNIELVSKKKELDFFINLGITANNEYLTGSNFTIKTQSSLLEIYQYSRYLKERHLSIEKLIETFIDKKINTTFNLKNLLFNCPSENTTYLEKIRIIAPEFESILKQYKLYVENNEIDYDLLGIGSKPLSIDKIPSITSKKYFYSITKMDNTIIHHLFSKNSTLYFLKEKIYNDANFFDLINNNKININQIQEHNTQIISFLQENKIIQINEKNELEINDWSKVASLKNIHENEVGNFWYYPKPIREDIIKFDQDESVNFSNSLFSISEQQYFNYYLNKSKYTNGHDLRNKYLHGSYISTEEEHKRNYFFYLKLTILILLKIDNDLYLNEFLKKQN